jgi:hypothetical protein
MNRQELEDDAIRLYENLSEANRKEFFRQLVLCLPSYLLQSLRNSALLETINNGGKI